MFSKFEIAGAALLVKIKFISVSIKNDELSYLFDCFENFNIIIIHVIL